jgi:hypothetical protein
MASLVKLPRGPARPFLGLHLLGPGGAEPALAGERAVLIVNLELEGLEALFLDRGEELRVVLHGVELERRARQHDDGVGGGLAALGVRSSSQERAAISFADLPPSFRLPWAVFGGSAAAGGATNWAAKKASKRQKP